MLNELTEEFGPSNKAPSKIDRAYHLFWTKGIDYNSFNKLPIPYIIHIIRTEAYLVEQAKKESKKKRGSNY